jgi:hypothetical protein
MSPSILGPIPEHVLRLMPGSARKPLGKAGLTMPELSQKAAVKREKELQQTCASMLRLRDIWFSASRMDKKATNTKGTPDFLMCMRGKFIAIEFKRPGEKPSEEQIKAIEAIERNGGIVRIVTSERDFVEFMQEVESIASNNEPQNPNR